MATSGVQEQYDSKEEWDLLASYANEQNVTEEEEFEEQALPTVVTGAWLDYHGDVEKERDFDEGHRHKGL